MLMMGGDGVGMDAGSLLHCLFRAAVFCIVAFHRALLLSLWCNQSSFV